MRSFVILMMMACMGGVVYGQQKVAAKTAEPQATNSVGKPLPKDAIMVQKAPDNSAAKPKATLTNGTSPGLQRPVVAPAKNATATPKNKQ